ncbi:hypothetical protein D9758_007965 [Tetrapyrgos nigripes]|uniref:Tetrapyrrole biosynthesis uroporphyrinogen III synthase domain-containing protein n=1 Tax=Tetrapyrgos nigripes TaxID=182062 RepID=A0A8H5D5C1_9AGAR|nr:hypothetical protein D9758_007965 [Tetrapyrgos nigripes]
MATNNPTNVLLLRAPDDPASSDKYLSAFANSRWNAVCVPVLETTLVNLEELSEILRNLVKGEIAEGRIDGVIITSARACEAWRAVVDGLIASSSSPVPMQVPIYVVGTATRNALLQIYFARSSSPYSPDPCLILGAEEAGNAEQLAQFILRQQQLPKRLLYLTGDKNRDTLPTILSAHSIALTPLQVYETRGSSAFKDDLKATVDSWPHGREEGWWTVFFAPSSSSFVLPFLQSDPRVWERRKVAAIGKTTDTHLREELGLAVHAVAKNPSPEGLIAALQSAENS